MRIFAAFAMIILLSVPATAARVHYYAGAAGGYSMLSWNEFELESDSTVLLLDASNLPKRTNSYKLLVGVRFLDYGLEGFFKQTLPASNADVKYETTSAGLDALVYLFRKSSFEIFAGLRAALVFTDMSVVSVGDGGTENEWNLKSEGVGYGLGFGAMYNLGRTSVRLAVWSVATEGLQTPGEIESSASVLYWF